MDVQPAQTNEMVKRFANVNLHASAATWKEYANFRHFPL